MMKTVCQKYLSLLMALVLLLTLSPLSALAEEEVTYPEELIVGHPTITKGDFFTEMFGNDTADIDVRALIHGYNLVNWDQNQGVYIFDKTVVTNVEMATDILDNHIYTLTLADDLYYSDGSPITAWDYAFSLLLLMAPEIEQIGGKIYRCEHILGYKDYITGEASSLAGLQVKDDRTLVITLDHAFLPYFFETGLLLCVPYPIAVIAPGCKVYDDGQGCYIGNADSSVEAPIFNASLLMQTILDPDTGYNSHPSVVSGPYVMTSYDGVTAHFEINPYFKGAWVNNTLLTNGGANSMNPDDPEVHGAQVGEHIAIPTIEKIAFTVADNDTMAEDLASGKLHLVNKVVYGPTIQECLGIPTVLVNPQTGEEETVEGPDMGGIRFENYPRIGMSFLTFTYEWPTVHEKEVRQAIAWCMDRDQMTEDYCGPYGIRVDGYYGIEQWEYLLVTQQIDYPVNFIHDEEHRADLEKFYPGRFVGTEEEYEEAIAIWKTLSLDKLTEYKVDLDMANALLDSAKWTLNRNGEPYQAGVDDVRCKMVDGELVALDLSLMYPKGNHIVDTLDVNMLNNLAQVGIKVTLVPTPMEELLRSYYRETERTTDMIYLATNFHVIVDPSITYSTDTSAGHLMWNNTYSDDEDLYWRAVNMRKTDPDNVFDYVSKWISFQERYNEVLPTIPIYSNIYFDFFTEQLQNYYITAHVTWTQAILEAFWGQEGDTPPGIIPLGETEPEEEHHALVDIN